MRTDTVYAEPYPQEVRAAIYCRLSKDDDLSGPSASIQNQRELLCRYCEEQGWRVAGIFQDDGFTGLNMDRPDFQKMLGAVERGMFDVILTKDLSRLGRNYLQTGQLIEEFFPRNKVRYIALNDAVDTNIENDITPFRNILNEMYSRDVSKKVHSSYLTKAKSGKFTGCLAPFGYKKDPLDKNRLIVDEDTAWIVRKIFDYARNGSGPNRIRRRLEDEEIPCPAWWNRQKGLRDHITKFERENPERGRFVWDFTTIKEILSNPVYIGAIASQKVNYRFKIGWMGDKRREDWIIVEGMHEAIIDRDTYDTVQEKVKSRKRADAWGNFSLFAGLVKCGQCGSTMNIRRANQKGNDRIYTCSRYNKYGKAHCTQHRIKYDTLYGIVLEQIRSCAEKALADEQEAADQLRENCQADEQAERLLIEQGIAEDSERIDALERIISRVYEDMVAGRITEDNFNRILERSQTEQTTLINRVTLNRQRLTQQDQEQEDNTRWLEIIKDYADIQELDAVTLNRLVQKIVIHEDIDSDTTRQTVEIHFNFNNQTDKRRIVQEK
ncbi:recombinase family protein [uncultured Oscillibacter sp.]|uniref:recombinase family protein n=1 Tax=uncultured Oscillibacter sp. TaxID=876091 RepID=UPI0025FF87C1|nr:recombinase family protein [uncultured Oscillibacter sp.]